MSKTRLYCMNECTDEKDNCDDNICCYNCSEFKVCKRHNYLCNFLKVVPNATAKEIMTKCESFKCRR